MDRVNPAISILLVVGPLRRRAQRSLNALLAQTAIDRMEIVVVDMAPSDKPALEYAQAASVKYVRRPDLKLWSEGRYEGLKLAEAPIIASIEDHAYAAPRWAEALLEAHQGPWAAVGYAFVNANPRTYLSRASLVNDYGPWMHPTGGGPTDFVPGHNISYRRDVLESFGKDLKDLYALDFSVQAAIRERGLPMYVEPRAIVAHENFTRIRQIIGVNVAYGRLFAGQRMRVERWSFAWRLLYAALVPLGSPAVSAFRYVRSMAPRPEMRAPAIKASPLFIVTRLFSGVAESIGYLFGSGAAEREVMGYWEMKVVRSTVD